MDETKSTHMKAIVCGSYGSPDVLTLREVDKPSIKDNQVLIRNYATTVTAADTMMRKGKPYIGRLYLGLKRPNKPILGFEFAGEVVETGRAVSLFKMGDKVFGGTTTLGGYAEYICVDENAVILKMPDNITYQEAAPVSGSGTTILNFLKRLGNIRSGDKVLINGASGGLGTYAVQYAKIKGAMVTGVCSTGNLELVRSLGAHRVIDYSKDDFAKGGDTYDIIFDTVGKRTFNECKGSLTKNGVYLSPVLNPNLVRQSLRSMMYGSKKARFSFTGMLPIQQRLDYFKELSDLLQNGQLKTVLSSEYKLSEVSEAHRYVEEGHKRGNLVVSMMNESEA
jgi:NADPH:quinone reductase-like Zn-dependent oxidoreductase